MTGSLISSPAALRNRGPILEVLQRVLPTSPATVLEIAAGSGEHALHFAPRFPHLAWQPSDISGLALAAIESRRQAANIASLRPPIRLDVTAAPWAIEDTPPALPVTAILAINMIHIAPWAACQGLMAGAGRLLGAGGILCLYGPFIAEDTPTAPSNRAFDADLRARNRNWGLRDLDRVVAGAAGHGLALAECIPMPANNLSLIFSSAD